MLTNFRLKHLVTLLDSFEKEKNTPLDRLLSQYLRSHKEIGSKDRKIISDLLYEIIRWENLLLALVPPPVNTEKKISCFLSNPLSILQATPHLEPHQKVGCPKELYDYCVSFLGEKKTIDYCLGMNQKAPISIRVNLLKTTREALFNSLKKEYDVCFCEKSDLGIIFHQKINLHALDAYKGGLFEIQDEASQLIANLVDAKPGDEVLDYCAGGGGKSLAIAPKMQNRGQIFLHDIRKRALTNAKMRLKRAGIQNAQTILTPDQSLSKLKGRMNWILVDAPCTGSGTWRRNPDQKNRFSLAILENLVNEQRNIFEESLRYLHPKGKIVYATCSIFPEENEKQVAYFLERFPLSLEPNTFQSFPQPNEMDGFFGAVFSFRS